MNVRENEWRRRAAQLDWSDPDAVAEFRAHAESTLERVVRSELSARTGRSLQARRVLATAAALGGRWWEPTDWLVQQVVGCLGESLLAELRPAGACHEPTWDTAVA